LFQKHNCFISNMMYSMAEMAEFDAFMGSDDAGGFEADSAFDIGGFMDEAPVESTPDQGGGFENQGSFSENNEEQFGGAFAGDGFNNDFGGEGFQDMPANMPLGGLDSKMDGSDLERAALNEWEAQRIEVLAAREEESRKRKEEVRVRADTDLAAFYSRRDEKIAKTKSQNREDEKQRAASTARLNESGGKWEKIYSLCDLAPKQNAKGERTDRMRKLLVSLKHDSPAEKTIE
jgi:hypothetical protein